jgi:hypothetical protein
MAHHRRSRNRFHRGNYRGPLPIEVKFSAATSTEPVALRNFRSTYPDARQGIIVSRDTISSKGVPLIPAYVMDFVEV